MLYPCVVNMLVSRRRPSYEIFLPCQPEYQGATTLSSLCTHYDQLAMIPLYNKRKAHVVIYFPGGSLHPRAHPLNAFIHLPTTLGLGLETTGWGGTSPAVEHKLADSVSLSLVGKIDVVALDVWVLNNWWSHHMWSPCLASMSCPTRGQGPPKQYWSFNTHTEPPVMACLTATIRYRNAIAEHV